MYRCACASLFLAISAWLSLTHARTGVGAQVPKATPAKTDKTDVVAKEGEAKQVEIRTVDRVELKGKYYPGDKNAPCVMLLHALGDSCNNKEWTNLAKKLHDKGYAVLMFDFRGHGDSTTVQPAAVLNAKNPMPPVPGFWDEALNRQYVRGAFKKPLPTEIKYEQFAPIYYTVLANDIAAAKAFLDEQQDCDSSNLILIGANDGATLGALWLNSEFHRYRYVPAALGQPEGIDKQNPEGLAVKAAVWLSISPTLGTSKTPLNLAEMLNWPARANKVPMVFVFGEGDGKGGNVAKKVCDQLVPAKLKKDYPFTQALKITGAEQMTGKNLLLESLDTTDKILKFLEDVPEAKSARKGRKTADDIFVWEWFDPARGMQQQAVAKKKGADRVEFTGYAAFLR